MSGIGGPLAEPAWELTSVLVAAALTLAAALEAVAAWPFAAVADAGWSLPEPWIGLLSGLVDAEAILAAGSVP